jgi:hypothetical protein
MIYRIAANVLLFVHVAFAGVVMLGGFGSVASSSWASVHLPFVIWSVVVNLAGWKCPLTILENWMLKAAGEAGYEEGFVEHYMQRIVYPKGMPRSLRLSAAAAVLLWNVFVYTHFWR